MIKRIKKALTTFITDLEEEEEKNLIFFDPSQLKEPEQEAAPMVGLFAEVVEEKIGELVHALLYANDLNKHKDPKDIEPIDFYISTYGGSADDMFALYDVMRVVRERTPLHTVGLGKVMSAGVLILAAGTEGERKIAKNCRIMIHSVVGGNQGDLHNMLNEMEAIEQLQQMFIDCLVSETKLTKSRLKKMLERKVNVYLSAEEAVELGIADIII